MSAGRRSAWLGVAQAIEILLQVVLPILLVRYLTPTAFAEYRMAWLLAGTAAAVLPFGMPDVLGYTLAGAGVEDKRSHIAVVMLFLLGIAVLTALAVVAALSIGDSSRAPELVWVIALFCACWLFGVMLDQLPVADERGDWQAKVVICLALVRVVVASVAVIVWPTAMAVMIVMALVAGLRVLAVLVYAQRQHSLLSAKVERRHWRAHWSKAAPLGLSSLLGGLRRQADQWIALTLFVPQQFAAFSLGTVLSPIVLVVRRAITSTLVPAMSRLHARGNWTHVLEVNHRANCAVACIVAPILAYVWCFGDRLYSLVYTSAYLDAVPVMRLLTIVWLLQVVELNSLVMLAGQMPRVARINAQLVVLCALSSMAGAWLFGLWGATLGSLIGAFLERWMILRCLRAATGVAIGRLQPWRVLAMVVGLAFALAALGRLAFDLAAAHAPPVIALVLVGLLLPGPYWLVIRRFGWWPRSLAAT